MGLPLALTVFVSVFLLPCRIKSQACNGRFGQGDPKSKDDNVDSNTGFGYMIADSNNIIDCCGVIQQWDAFFTNVVGARTVYFQVWRLASGSSYTLVGENAFTVSTDGDQSKAIAQTERITIKPGDRYGWWTSGADVITYKTGGGEDDNNLLLSLADLNVGDTQDWSTASQEDGRSYALRVDVTSNSNPSFSNLPTTESITNDVTSGTSVFTVTTDDTDTYDISLHVLTMSSSTKFSLDSSTGVITTSTTFSTSAVETLVFTVTDQCSNSATATLTVSITNDPPTINNLPAAVTLSEDLTLETLIFTINATDTSAASTVTCSLASGGSGKFQVRLISTEYGVYTISNPSFDYNALSSYNLSIQCSDGDLSDTDTLFVYLQKNAPPVVTNLQNSTSISTTTSIGSTVFTVISTDAENDNLYYVMTCNPTPCPFEIFNSGEVRLNQDITNTTTVGYDLSINVSDSKNTVGPYVLTVTVADINDPVQITNLPIGSPLTIGENTALGTSVFTVSYSDVDTSQAHTFTMTSAPTSGSTYFSIGSSTGLISTSGSLLNYETLSSTSFTFTVTVTDPITSDTRSLSIDVTNINEAPSFSQSSYTLSTTEGTAGSVIGTPILGINDPDSGDSTTLSMDCGSSSGYFYINSSTGTVTFQSDYDLDTGSLPTSVSCNLTVTDSGGLSAAASLTIIIADVNDNVPLFSPTSYSFYISYYASSGTTVGTVTASDADIGSYGTLTYTINQTNLAVEHFSIDTNGIITVKQTVAGSIVGYSTSVTIRAIATDSGASSDTANVVIVISDTTTTTTTTTTDRQRTFFEDTKNIAWFLACMLALAVIAGYMMWLIYTCKGDQGCDNWMRRFRQRKKYKKHLQQRRVRQGPRLSMPDVFSTMDQLSVRTPVQHSVNYTLSVRKPPPPIGHQAWRSSNI